MTPPTAPRPKSAHEVADPNGADPSPSWEIELFHDGGCSLCAREVRLMRWLDRRDRVLFTDIVAPGFDPESTGRDYESLMARIHGRLPDGTTIEGVEVFRRVYAAIGLRWLVPLTRLPGIRWLLDRAYVRFARWRYRRRCRDGVCGTGS